MITLQKTSDRGFVWSYAFSAGGGFNFILALISSYLSAYLTDNLLIPAAAVSILMAVATIWDAVNDPMMGAIADRTKSRWGRYRGYFLFAPFAVAIFAIACSVPTPAGALAPRPLISPWSTFSMVWLPPC